ncbi:MAG: 50S ribosomal protein L3 [Deltaproteobacteria bacterium]|nr:50S ribosomal protein L3 [Deltaproteobacteria bacterium]
MRMGLLGKKIGMTQQYDAKGNWAALSVIELGPCVVLDVKTVERDGYAAIQLGFGDKSPQRTSKPAAGVFAKAKTAPKRMVREIRLQPDEIGQFHQGQVVRLNEVFAPGDVVDVRGVSRGKGFQGVMKRHNFSGFRATHGTHEYFRHGGSVGCRLTPGRVFKGKRMPGHMGARKVSIQNLRVAEVLPDKNLLLLRGAVPGAPDGYVTVRHAAKRPGAIFQLKREAPAAAEA